MKRQNPWLFERDGDLNPTWPLVVAFCVVGLAVCVGAIVTRNQYAIIAALSYLGSVTVALLIAALPISKAKVLAKSTAPGDVAAGIAEAASGVRSFGTSTAWFESE